MCKITSTFPLIKKKINKTFKTNKYLNGRSPLTWEFHVGREIEWGRWWRVKRGQKTKTLQTEMARDRQTEALSVTDPLRTYTTCVSDTRWSDLTQSNTEILNISRECGSCNFVSAVCYIIELKTYFFVFAGAIQILKQRFIFTLKGK